MKYLNALNKIEGIGAQRLKLLLQHFATGEKIWKADLTEIIQAGISQKIAERIIYQRRKINPDQELEKLKEHQIQIISFTDSEYPKLLREIPSAPYLLYLRGDKEILQTPSLAIVGSRKFTAYGKQVAFSLSQELARAGFTIVSGMALGIDSFAHQGALNASGKTIAVLGSSLDDSRIGPKQNFQLSRHIIANGALLSDYPLFTSANSFTFPARNRLMAGLTLGTIVIEAEEKSGTLITAKMATDFNREVFAVPGPIFSTTSTGVHQLIKNGAKLVSGIQDITEELSVQFSKASFLNQENQKQPTIKMTKQEEIIFKIINGEPIHINRIIKLSKLETKKVSSALAMLEMNSLIKDIGGQNYIRI